MTKLINYKSRLAAKLSLAGVVTLGSLPLGTALAAVPHLHPLPPKNPPLPNGGMEDKPPEIGSAFATPCRIAA